MRQRLQDYGAKGFVIGLNGTLDSAVVVRLAQLAAPGGALGALLPCDDTLGGEAEHDARSIAELFSLPTMRVDLSASYDALVRAVPPAEDAAGWLAPRKSTDRFHGPLALENIKPRLRMTALYCIANGLGYLVAGTSNRHELALGSFTKWGECGVDLLPVGHLATSQVRAIARELAIPKALIDRPRTVPLSSDRSEAEEIGVTCAELERYLDEGPQSVAPALAMRVERLARTSVHKRQLPPVPDFD